MSPPAVINHSCMCFLLRTALQRRMKVQMWLSALMVIFFFFLLLYVYNNTRTHNILISWNFLAIKGMTAKKCTDCLMHTRTNGCVLIPHDRQPSKCFLCNFECSTDGLPFASCSDAQKGVSLLRLPCKAPTGTHQITASSSRTMSKFPSD